jgi:hypothetical protein
MLLYYTSRQDAAFGPADLFNERICNETVAHFIGDIIDVEMAAKARTARTVAAAATNAHFTFPQLGSNFQYGETAAYQLVYGKWNLTAEDVRNQILTPKKYIDYFSSTYAYLHPVSLSSPSVVEFKSANCEFPSL